MPRVVVFGSSNTDMTIRVPRLPVPGQTVLGNGFSTKPGGKGANQAVAAQRAGAEVVFVTTIGNDELGQRSLDLYQSQGIDVSHIRIIDGVASGVALIFVAADGENMIGVASGANARLTPDDVDRLPSSLFRTGDVLLASFEIPVETSIRALRRGIEGGMRTILNPAPAPSLTRSQAKELLSDATVITPNRVEALTLAGWTPEPGIEPDWAACGYHLREMGPAVVITLGSRGCQVMEGKSRLVRAPRVEAVDTVGAGDAFNGALAVALAEGRPFDEAAQWANAAAALAVTQHGAQAALANREAIDQFAAREMDAN